MPIGSFIWGCFDATSKLKLVIVTLVVQQQLQPQHPLPPPAPPPPPTWLVKASESGHLILVRDTSNGHSQYCLGLLRSHFKTQGSYCLRCCIEWFLINPFYLHACNCARLFHTKYFFLFSALHSI